LGFKNGGTFCSLYALFSISEWGKTHPWTTKKESKVGLKNSPTAYVTNPEMSVG
jgi:hypothetical protein